MTRKCRAPCPCRRQDAGGPECRSGRRQSPGRDRWSQTHGLSRGHRVRLPTPLRGRSAWLPGRVLHQQQIHTSGQLQLDPVRHSRSSSGPSQYPPRHGPSHRRSPDERRARPATRVDQHRQRSPHRQHRAPSQQRGDQEMYPYR